MKRLMTLMLLCASVALGQGGSTGNITASGSTCGTTNACVVLPLGLSDSIVSVQITGTFSATLKPEKTVDGTTWVSAGADLTTTGVSTYAVSASRGFRIRASAYVSGTAAITLRSAVTEGNVNATSGSGAPSGTCTVGVDFYTDTDDGSLYTCPDGTWTLSGGTGTPGGSPEDIQFNDAGAFGGITPGDDKTYIAALSGVWTVTTPGISARTDADGTAQIVLTDLVGQLNVTHATATAVDNFTTGLVAGFATRLCVADDAGPATFTPAAGTVNGHATLILNMTDCALLRYDGTNWEAEVNRNFFTLTIHQWGTGASNVIQDTDDWTSAYIAEAGTFPFTIKQICGRADTGTSTFNLQRNDGSAASIAASNIVAATTSACTSTFTAGENEIAVGNAIDFLQVTGATSGSPTHITVTISAVKR